MGYIRSGNSENFGRIVETVFRRTDREMRGGRARIASVRNPAHHVAWRGLMRAGAPIARCPPASLAVILRGCAAMRSLSGTRHDRASTERGVCSQRARLAVEAVVLRSAVPPDWRTGPRPAPRRDR